MSAPSKLRDTVFILLPINSNEIKEEDIIRTLRRLCLFAFHSGKIPICPTLIHGTYMPPDELSMQSKKLAWWWFKRSSEIWMHFLTGEEDLLDPLSYRLLEYNEVLKYDVRHSKDKQRKPVAKVFFVEEEAFIERVTRKELSYLIRSNLTNGLFPEGVE